MLLGRNTLQSLVTASKLLHHACTDVGEASLELEVAGQACIDEVANTVKVEALANTDAKRVGLEAMVPDLQSSTRSVR